MTTDRQAVIYGLIEGSLRAAADPVVTTVLRDWDFYAPGTSAQPLVPFLVVGVTDDVPYGPGLKLHRATVQIMIVAAQIANVRDIFARVLASVRSVMATVRRLSYGGVLLCGCQEISCTQPDHLNDSGDIILAQILTYRLFFEAPLPPPATLDPVPYLVDRDPQTGVTYVTCQADDPRRIDRWTPSGSTLMLEHGFGAWADRVSLVYTSPVEPLSTMPATPSAIQANE